MLIASLKMQFNCYNINTFLYILIAVVTFKSVLMLFIYLPYHHIRLTDICESAKICHNKTQYNYEYCSYYYE